MTDEEREKYIREIIEMTKSMDKRDDTFIKQIYTIMKKHNREI
ncbi:MAG: hypothetical protein ACERKN_07305 [Velocimicrobium sp.]